MSSGHSELRRIFLEAVELPEEERGRFLESACGSNLELLQDVQSLLDYHHSETIVESRPDEPTQRLADNNPLTVALRSDTPTLPPLVRIVARALQDHRGAFLSTFVAIALVAALGMWTLHAVRSTLRSSNKAQLNRILAAQARAIDEWIEHRIEQAESWTNSHQLLSIKEKLKSSSELTAEDRSHLLGLTKAYAGQRDTAACVIVDSEGLIVWSNKDELNGKKIEDATMKTLGRAYKGKTTFVRPRLIRSQVTSESGEVTPVSWIATPLRSGDQIVGLIGFGSDANGRFSDLLNVTRMGETGKSFVLDDAGHLLTWRYAAKDLKAAGLLEEASNESRSSVPLVVGNSGPPENRPLTQLAEAVKVLTKEGQLQGDLLEKGYKDFRGKPVFGAWRWLPEYQVALATEVDVHEANEPLSIIGWTFTVMIGTLAVTVVLGFVVAFQMSRQILDSGQVLGPYTLHDKIGEGGMGKVYLASHALLRRQTAVKILNREHSSQRDIDRFHREVQLASSLTHPNTVEIYDFGQSEDGIFYCAMEYIDGLTLTQLVRDAEFLSVGRAKHLLLQVCDSVQEAHQLGLMHRDLKPANLLVCRRGGIDDVVKVVDFGLAKSIEQQHELKSLTKTSEIVGTPMYMAPERFDVESELDVRSDIYAIGAVGYFLCTGQTVFAEAPLPALIKTILKEPPRQPSPELNAEWQPLFKIILSCLAKDPAARPQTAAALRTQLNELLTDEWTALDANQWWDVLAAGRTKQAKTEEIGE